MSVSPFTFYRGAAKIMATDLRDTPTAGLNVKLCGDAPLSNFGGFASPERTLLFDVNDFDETLPGPFEYDVKRMAASFTIAGRNNGFTKSDVRAIQRQAIRSEPPFPDARPFPLGWACWPDPGPFSWPLTACLPRPTLRGALGPFGIPLRWLVGGWWWWWATDITRLTWADRALIGATFHVKGLEFPH